MKIKKPKRIMSLFLAALMCVTSLVGIGTTAYAAEETDDVYLISYPRDGDSNYNAEWGHGSLTFMNGWKTGTSRYTTVRAFPSFPARTGGRKTLFPLRVFISQKRKSRTAKHRQPLSNILRTDRIFRKYTFTLITTMQEEKQLRR